MPNDSLPRFVSDILASPPAHGEGVHKWMFKTARYLHAFRTSEEIDEILRATLHGCGRRIPEREIRAAVIDAHAVAWVPGEKQSVIYQSTWPKFSKEKYTLVTSDCDAPTAADLWESSPVRYVEDKSYTESIIDYLFPHNPYLCCGYSSTVFESMRRYSWRGELEKQQFIVPTPCIAGTGLTKDGKVSAHCLDNTGPREYLVIEQDAGNEDQQVAVIVHLSKFLPLCMVLSSGGKSLHAWFNCKGKDDHPNGQLMDFMRTAVALGADDATWTKSQFVRMPDGLRENGKRQSVFFFNPQASE
jgi:hypothetical protein